MITIGAESDGGRPWLGCIDEVNIWERELTASDISKLYNVGNGLKYVDLPFSFPSVCVPTRTVANADTVNAISRGDISNTISNQDVSKSINRTQ